MKIIIFSSARPEQVFYGGTIRGESAMIFKDDIGSRVVHTFQAYNAGPGKLRNLEIHIKWPIQVANNKPQGKWLLYLEDIPIVEGEVFFFSINLSIFDLLWKCYKIVK